MIITPRSGPELRREANQRRSARTTQRAMMSNACVGVNGIITFGHQAQPLFERLAPDAQDAAYREVAEAVASRLGTTLTGLVVHCDESAPHAHFQLVGYCLDGTPVSAVAKRGPLRDLQTFVGTIMGRHAPGIERGRSKVDRLKGGATPAEVVHRSVAELHDDLPYEIAALRAQVADLQVQIMDAEAKAATNDERAGKARRKAEKDEAAAIKALRNVETYERRAKVARDEAERLQGEIEAAQARVAGAEEAAAAAVQRLAGIERREQEVEAREIAATACKKELDEEWQSLATTQEWVERGMGNLQVAIRRAQDGTHDDEVHPEDMADKPVEFAVLKAVAPDGRPT